METKARVIQGEIQLPTGRLMILKFPHRLDPLRITGKDLDVFADELSAAGSGTVKELRTPDALLSRFDDPAAIPSDAISVVREYISQRLEANENLIGG